MPSRLRRLLYSSVYYIADTRNARGQTGGVRCVQLDANNLCMLFGSPLRPMVCGQFDYDPTVCGEHRDEALATLSWLEESTR